MQIECVMHARSDVCGISPLVPAGYGRYAQAYWNASVQIGNNGKLKNYDGSNPDNKLLKISCAIRSSPVNISLA